MLSDIISNHLLMNALLAWATAQILKFFIYLAVNRTIDWKRLTGDGGNAQRPFRHRDRTGGDLRSGIRL